MVDHAVIVSPAMTNLLAVARRAAESPATVLITGESGVGKDLVARYIHDHSSRKLAPFVAVNCAGFTEARVESELDEEVNGKMAGSWPEKRSQIRLAHRGTLFLDNVGDMIPRLQSWLLRLLANGEIQAVEPDQSQTPFDVRVVAATNRDLNHLVATGQFREDLLYRLRVIHLHVPPLRERPEAIHALVQHFIACSGRELRFTDDALGVLRRYSWPGNVRELQNLVEQLVWLLPGAVIGVQHLPVAIRSSVTADWGGERAPRSKSRPHYESASMAGSPKGGWLH